MRVVVDASVIVGAALKDDSTPMRALLAVAERDSLVLSTAAIWIEPSLTVTDCVDPDDNKYLELALASQAVVIVSSDRHLLQMHLWRGIAIQRPAEYLVRP